MRRIASTVFLLTWALWFGGLMFLFFAVSALFGAGHALGVAAAPAIFVCFEKYHLALAVISLITSALLMRSGIKCIWRWICACIGFGCLTSVMTSQWITPRINALHLAGRTNTLEFRHLHGMSFIIYLCEAIVLLITGLMLPAAMTGLE